MLRPKTILINTKDLLLIVYYPPAWGPQITQSNVTLWLQVHQISISWLDFYKHFSASSLICKRQAAN